MIVAQPARMVDVEHLLPVACSCRARTVVARLNLSRPKTVKHPLQISTADS